MSLVLKEPGIDPLLQLLPCDPLEKLREPSAQVVLAVQVNYFACGGMAIGVCIRHEVADASAAAGLLKSMERVRNALQAEVVTKRLVFDGSNVATLRNEIGNGLIRSHIGSTRRCRMVLSLVLSLRAGSSRKRATWRGLPGPIIGALVESRFVAEKGYLEEGYLVLDKVRSESRPKRGRGLPGAVRSEAIQSEAVRGRPRSQGVWSDTIPHRFHKTSYHGPCLYHSTRVEAVSSLIWKALIAGKDTESGEIVPVFPFYETDFGWGKPLWFATALKLNNVAIFLDTSDGSGIEAWIGLPKEEMTKLEQDPGILAYASFIPTI
ncbi:hypothetical protein PTKIN_Ptkin04bG0033600 [Pterospermum kingtungense]